jgi:hypothetical protein
VSLLLECSQYEGRISLHGINPIFSNFVLGLLKQSIHEVEPCGSLSESSSTVTYSADLLLQWQVWQADNSLPF